MVEIKEITLGDRMLKYRAKNKITQRQLGALLGVSLNSICRYESGKFKPHRANEIRISEKMKELEEKESV